MKSLKSLCILFLLILITLTGCTNASKDIISQGNDISKEKLLEVEKIINESEEVPSPKIRPKIVDPLLERFSSNVGAEDLAFYIKDNIESASEDEADKMIQWLMIYQNKDIDDLYDRIDKDKFNYELDNCMNGSLDASKVDDIEDEMIKHYSNILINSFLTIYNYEEHLVIENNWNDLIKFSPYLSHDMSEIIRLSKKLNYYEYNREELDVEGLSKDIITLEKIAKKSNSTFIKWKANEICRSLMVDLLLGPENVYLFYYDGKEGKEYKAIIDLKDKYPDSRLTEVIEELDLIGGEDIWESIDIINKKFQFGLDSDNFLEVSNIENRNGEYELIEMFIPSNIDKQNRINDMISLDQEQFIHSSVKDNSFSLYSNIRFVNDRYISYSYSLRDLDSKGDHDRFYSYKTLDYMEERFISLEDYFDADFIFIQEYIEKLAWIKPETLTDFLLTEIGIDIHLNKERDEGQWISINREDLLEYFTFEELINWNF